MENNITLTAPTNKYTCCIYCDSAINFNLQSCFLCDHFKLLQMSGQ